MNISSNLISGSVPYSVSRLQNLTNLDLRNNSLGGSVPYSIGSLNSLLELQLGSNQLRGDMPPMPTSLQIALNLSHNLFEGTIPMSIAELIALEVLDLSNNKFSGVIPDFLTKMAGLTQLTLPNNQLSGVIPKFAPYLTVVTSGNEALKNSSSNTLPKRKKTVSVGLLVGVAAVAALVGGLVTVIALVKSSSHRINVQWVLDQTIHDCPLDFAKVKEVVQRPTNIVLKGEFYTYYRALMPCGTCFWIKRLYFTSNTFTLVSPDKFAEELKVLSQFSQANIMMTTNSALVVYECPRNGTLFDILHGSDQNLLTWENRYNIAVGVITGLANVHRFYDSSSAPVALFHISTRSIFMRSLSEPLIGDVELIKVINPSKSLGTLSVVAGSVGYVPPEYAYTMRVTQSGNIYGVGTILLELLTGKKSVNDGVELAKWALSKSIQDDQFDEILDSRVSSTSSEAHQQMVSMFRIALSCVSIYPEERPDAKELLAMILDHAQ